jgi:chemotaxis protein MotB
MARRKEAHGGGHGWFVTFADLMGLLVAFFVMLRLFDPRSGQVAWSRARCATLSAYKIKYAIGIIEVGLPTRPKLKNVAHRSVGSPTPAPDENERQRTYGARQGGCVCSRLRLLRQALQEMPEITEAPKHIMLEETKQGLNIEIVDQDGP